MKLYNTLSRSVEEFVPLVEGKVSMYTCGPTVYNYAHIGNLKTYILEDVLQKTLEYAGYEVNRVMNITDVGHLQSDADDGEDKMLSGAKRENKTVWEIAEHYTEAFFSDCAKLNIKKPLTIAKATDYVEAYIEMIKTLETKGFTYFTNGNVYFDISKFPNYTQLSRMDLDNLRSAAREDVEEDVNKRNPHDFVLWFTKSKFDNQAMKWESPWGTGYPGWHIECSAIALKTLGEQMDIHCGGIDHIPVHHTNEIAQTESYTGKKWVNYWWHGEFLVDHTGKMSKSKGEFLTLALLESKGFSPLVYRYFILNSQYRKQLVFTYESLEMAKAAYGKLLGRVGKLLKEAPDFVANNEALNEVQLRYDTEFSTHLQNDMNISNAVTSLYNVLQADDLSAIEKLSLVDRFDRVLSLDLILGSQQIDETESDFTTEEISKIEGLIADRKQAKKNKDFAEADRIRDVLLAEGIVLEDTREGVKYKRV